MVGEWLKALLAAVAFEPNVATKMFVLPVLMASVFTIMTKYLV